MVNIEFKKRGKYILNLTLEKIFNKKKIRKDGFELDLYIYTPDSLAINAQRLSINDFLKYTIVLTRFKTPPISLKTLLNKEYIHSPINFLKNKKEWGIIIDKEEDKCIYEMKTLVNIVRHQLSVNLEYVRQKTKNKSIELNLLKEDLFKTLDEFLTYSRKFINDLDEIAIFFLSPDNTSEIKRVCNLTLEAILIEMQNTFLLIKNYLQKREGLEGFFHDRFVEEINYLNLITNKYCIVSVFQNSSKNKARYFLYRINELKKWSQDTLYIPTAKSKIVEIVGHLILGMAAVVAMGFSVVATILSMHWFTAGSFYWAIIAIIAYLFKDRIKEILRSMFEKFIPKVVSNRIYKIFDTGTKMHVGVSKERASFINKDKIPENISLIRNSNKNLLSSKRESILYYNKELLLDLKILYQNHNRLHGITEIIRFDLKEWFNNMDDHNQRMPFWDNIAEKVSFTHAERVYHINFIIRTHSLDSKEINFYRYRVICSRVGILEIEKQK